MLLFRKKFPNYLFKGVHNAQNSNSMASMSSNSQYPLAKVSFDQFLDHNIIVKSCFIDFYTFGAVIWLPPHPFWAKIRPKHCFLTEKYT